MKNFSFVNAEEFICGIRELQKTVSFDIAEGGIVVTAHPCEIPTLKVTFDGDDAHIWYKEKCQFFRAFGLLLEHILNGEEKIDITESPAFTMNGVMFDMSQGNAAFNQKTMENVLRKMALMGLNTLMLYCEDNYEVKEQPYFGYMRPTYTGEDMKKMDDYAYSLGIEMIPCIQTLAHMPDALRWAVYDDIRDYDGCLLVGEDKTYRFLDDIIRNATSPFRTKKVHIGMDEAWHLGTGQYLRKNGYRKTGDIIKNHLDRLIEIIRKYDLEPMMWDDMYFYAFGDGTYRQTAYPVPQEVKDMVPPEMRCIYWDYSMTSEARFKKQLELCDRIVFAGGSWAWFSYGLAYNWTVKSSVNALKNARTVGIKEVFMTTWGDNGAEALQTVNLLGAQVYAEIGYASEFDEEKFKKRFAFCTGASADDFALLEGLDKTPDSVGIENEHWVNASKYLMWQDILTGLLDKNIEGVPLTEHYTALAEKLHEAEKRNGDFNSMFEMSALVADVLALKSEMGLRLTAAYRSGDRDTLRKIAQEELPELSRRVAALRESNFKNWMCDYKPIGWDILDMRYGALLARIDTAARTVSSYLSGEIAKIEELEVERLNFQGVKGPLKWYNFYGPVVSASRIDGRA